MRIPWADSPPICRIPRSSSFVNWLSARLSPVGEAYRIAGGTVAPIYRQLSPKNGIVYMIRIGRAASATRNRVLNQAAFGRGCTSRRAVSPS